MNSYAFLMKIILIDISIGRDYESSLLSRLSYSSFQEFEDILRIITNRVPFTDTIKLALMFCVMVRRNLHA